jgi:hypothetical protein
MMGPASNDRFLDLLDSDPHEAERKYRALRGTLWLDDNGKLRPAVPQTPGGYLERTAKRCSCHQSSPRYVTPAGFPKMEPVGCILA